MGRVLPHGVHETTSTSGILGPANAIALNGATSGRWAFSSQLANLDTTEIVVTDTNAGTWEVMEATFTAPSTLTPTATRLASSAGGAAIDWPATGARDVVVAVRGASIASLLDPAQPVGLVARQSQDVYGAVSLQPDADSRLTWNYAGGVSGNPTPVLTGLYAYLAAKFLDFTSGAAAAARTMLGRLVLGATSTVIQGRDGSGNHDWYGDDALTDRGFRSKRIGANDWRWYVNVGGFLQRALTLVDPTAAEATKVARATATGYEYGPKLADAGGSGNAGRLVAVNAAGDGYAVDAAGTVVEQDMTALSTHTFSGIPSWAREITISFYSVGISASNHIKVQLGDAGGIEATGGYASASGSGGDPDVTSTTGFLVKSDGDPFFGCLTLRRVTGNAWSAGVEGATATGRVGGGGGKTLSDTLTQVLIGRSGSGTYSGGTVRLEYR